jgi:uncharacterized protein (TIGR00251 family)
MKVIETKEGSMLEILVKPRSKTFKIIVENDEIVALCREEPTKGKVNKELVKELSTRFHRRVELVSGFSSRQKRILITGVKKSEVERALLDKPV